MVEDFDKDNLVWDMIFIDFLHNTQACIFKFKLVNFKYTCLVLLF